MTAPEVRLSPDATRIATRFPGEEWWSVQRRREIERFVSDEDVSGWTPLLPASNKDGES